MPARLAFLGSLLAGLLCGIGYAGYVGYDATFALIWGRELAGLDAPAFTDPWSPTPHPLMNAVGALLAPLGAGASAAAVELVALAGVGLLGAAGFRLGAALFSTAAGVACAALLVTRPEIVELALFAQFDVPFLALVVLACALEAERGGVAPHEEGEPEAERARRGVAPLVALALAGLLRPEAWVLAAAYALWLRRPRLLALAAAGPALWLLHDLVLTGDPLFSLHGTREFADRHQPGNGIADAFELAPRFVADVTGVVVALGGAAGWLLVPRAVQQRVALPAALFGLSLCAFLAYGVAGLTLYARFLLPAAAALTVLCAAAATGWRREDLDAPRRAAAIAVAAAVAVSLPFTAADLADVREKSAERARLEASLVDLLRERRGDVDACGVVYAPSYRVVPTLLHRLDLPGARFTDRPTEAAGVLRIGVAGRRGHVAEQLESDPVPPAARAPAPGDRLVARNADWLLSAGC